MQYYTFDGINYDLANYIRWSFGNCDSDYKYYDYELEDYSENVYLNNRTYNQTCCFNTSPNNWVLPLVCKSGFAGWDDGYITIEGKRYCDNFPSGYQKTVYVEANPS